MPQIPSRVDDRILRPAQTALGLGLVSRMDLLRLKGIARVYARGLPPEMAWEDMLQEALTRIVTGSRRRPEGLLRILDGFARELIEAPEEEIREAAQDLGMDPEARMSAAFAGVTYPARPQLSDFFDVGTKRLTIDRNIPDDVPDHIRGDVCDDSPNEFPDDLPEDR
jgi:hypothetical protein